MTETPKGRLFLCGRNGMIMTKGMMELFTNVNNPQNRTIRASLYPNPASELINIDAPGYRIESVSIFDITGREILRVQPMKTDQIKISATALPKGMYIVKAGLTSGEEIGRVWSEILIKD